MERRDYELSTYMDMDIPEIIALEKYLWGQDEKSRSRYFEWKLQRNPILKEPVGIVAKDEGKVIGFRGYIPVQWRAGDKKFKVLLLSDTVVHPDYRGKGLFSAMTKAGMKMYCNEYKFFVAFTSNHMSTPGYLKLGWQSLAAKKYVRHLNLLGLAKARIFGADQTGRDFQKIGRIEVADRIRPEDVSRIAENDGYSKNKLCLEKSPDFLEWKLSNPNASFVYLYHLTESRIDAYIILRIQNNHAHIFDYGQENGSSGIQNLISFIIVQGKFSSISAFHAGMPEQLKSFLRKKHFYMFDLLNRLRDKKNYNLPILVRPTLAEFSEDDWFANDLDIREIDNWHITEICFD